jgi:hypothetical protein
MLSLSRLHCKVYGPVLPAASPTGPGDRGCDDFSLVRLHPVNVNWTTVSSLATAGGTLVLAVATFAAVRSANRSARISQRSFEIGLRPILAPSRLEDPPQKVMFGDRHWVKLEGGRAVVEAVDGVVYLAMLIRNVGTGMAIIEGWQPFAGQLVGEAPWGSLEGFRPQTRSLWIAPNDVAFWQGALRDESDELQKSISAAVADGALTVDLLYSDNEGGHRTMSRFSFIRREGYLSQSEAEAERRNEGTDGHGHSSRQEWWVSLSRHRNS